MATFPANPVVGTTTATLGATTYKLTTRGWEVQSAGVPGSVSDVFDAISSARGHHPNPWVAQFDDEQGDGEFSTEDRIVAKGSPGHDKFARFDVWEDPTDKAVFLWTGDTNNVFYWVQAN